MTTGEGVPQAFVVEDDNLIADIFTTALKQVGYAAEKITGGAEAIQRLKMSVPDLVVLDIHMPIVSGLEVLKFIQGDERLSGVTVIVITADALAAQRLSGQVEHVLVKPVGFYQLKLLGEALKAEL